MTQAEAVEDPPYHLIPESFWGTILRRGRYVLAACVSGVLFYWVGWLVAAPPADMAGVSLLAWGAGSGVAALAGILIVATFLCTLLVHPDSPHMGLLCALLGMTALSARGGNVHMLFQDAADHGVYHRVSMLLALECVEWTVLFLIAEFFARTLHDKFFANTRWLNRSGVDLAKTMRVPTYGAGMGIAMAVSKFLRTLNTPRAIAIPLALVANILLASLFLYGFLQTPAKGQVIFACFVSFLLSTHLTFYAFAKVPALVFFLSVPLVAAIGYLLSAGHSPPYPGYPGLFFGRALPIDYVSAGISGAILGYYWALHWDLSSQHAEGAGAGG